MTLKQWASNGWLRPHRTSAEEIGNLLAIVKRDIHDAGQQGISADWRFGIAYNAALKLCTVLLYAEGYRPEKSLAHYSHHKWYQYRGGSMLEQRGTPPITVVPVIAGRLDNPPDPRFLIIPGQCLS